MNQIYSLFLYDIFIAVEIYFENDCCTIKELLIVMMQSEYSAITVNVYINNGVLYRYSYKICGKFIKSLQNDRVVTCNYEQIGIKWKGINLIGGNNERKIQKTQS